MPDLALQLIEEAHASRATFLDLGNCGLTAVPSSIVKLKDTLVHLNLGYAYFEEGKRVMSRNTSLPNDFSAGDMNVASLLDLWKLKQLSLASTSIDMKSSAALTRLVMLTYLDLSDNFIEATGAYNISLLPSLRHLYLTGNQIGNRGLRYISSMLRLEHLDLGLNMIDDSGISLIGLLRNLRTLKLFRNKITQEGAEHFRTLSDLTELDLNGNKIGDGGAILLGNLQQLTSLGLYDNDITDRGAEAIGKHTLLKSLHLGDNRISTEGAQFIGRLSGLNQLQLGGNAIATKGAEYISQLTQLTRLDLTGNNIRDDGAEHISRLPALSILHLGANRISSRGAEAIGKLSTLTTLDLSANTIGDIGTQSISKLSSLITLDLSANIITDRGAIHISKLSSLDSLTLTGNELTDQGASYLSQLRQLRYLDLDANKIHTGGTRSLIGMRSLEKLSLKNNEIRNVPPELFKKALTKADIEITKDALIRVGNVYLQGNPIINPPIEVLRQGPEVVIEYLDESRRPLNECKLIFIGDGSVGKTSLMKRLVYDTFDPEEQSTHGINKVAWNDLKNEKGEAIKVNLWDFGGQHIQHSLHQFFFTERVIYVLVLDPRNDLKAAYWLDQIENLGRDSHILIVHNYKSLKDTESSYLNNFYELRKTYPRLKEPILLSCATGDNMGAFRIAVQNAIFNNEGLKTQYPDIWFQIKRRLEEEISIEINYIEYPKYERICEELGYEDKERRKSLIRILNSIGSIVFFDKPVLENLQVLNPEWITTGAYAILTSKITASKKGHLTWDDLKMIFAEKKEIFSDKKITITYTETQFHFILELMIEYGLCQRNPFAGHEYLIPSAFGKQPKKDYHAEVAEGRHYRFRFESPFEMLIMYRFIAKNIVHLTGKDYWNSGIFFKHATSDTYALVITNLYSKKIDCRIGGENIRGLWEVIRSDFREIFKSYHNFPVKEEVAYQDQFLPYEEMLNSLRNNVTRIHYHPTYNLFDIDVPKVLELFELPDQTQQNMLHETAAATTVNISPNIQVNPVITNAPTFNNHSAGESTPPEKPAGTPGPGELRCLKKWQRQAIILLLLSLALTALLVVGYIKEWLLSPAAWKALKKYDVYKYASVLITLFWNGFIVKFMYDRHFDPTKIKAYLEYCKGKSHQKP